MKKKCNIYVCSKATITEIDSLIHKINANPTIQYLDVEKNDFFDRRKEHEFPDGFLYFENIILIEFNASTDTLDYINLINSILDQLWDKRIPSVASCNFEHLLNNNGGYKSKDIPWLK